MTDYTDLWHRLTDVYDAREAQAIVRYVLNVRFGLSATDVYCGKVTKLSADEGIALDEIMQRLAEAEPVQYVLGEAKFCGRPFFVEPGVLIPRPETEELCRWVAASVTSRSTILDIGTGSGCIAITLAKELDQAEVTAWDISDIALMTAKRNATRLNVHVDFAARDALNLPNDSERWTVIVSNPPYVCVSERQTMHRNVLGYEPRVALFVPDEAPLLFYRSIAHYAATALKHGGQLFFEINPRFADDVSEMLVDKGFESVETRVDFCGKQRFVRALRP